MTFLTKNEWKSPTNHGCTLNSLKSKMGFGSPFLLEASRINPPNSPGTVTSPFTDKKGSQNRDVSTNCLCIQLGSSRMRLSVTMKLQNKSRSVVQMGREKHDLKKQRHYIITKFYHVMIFTVSNLEQKLFFQVQMRVSKSLVTIIYYSTATSLSSSILLSKI